MRPEGFYAYPENGSLWRRLLWRRGFDPLTVSERLTMTRVERDHYRDLLHTAMDSMAETNQVGGHHIGAGSLAANMHHTQHGISGGRGANDHITPTGAAHHHG
jgi:hypothetical protein